MVGVAEQAGIAGLKTICCLKADLTHRHVRAMCRRQMDADYHFAAQFTADLIAMNHTDFIITSTFQEIAGTEVFLSMPQAALSASSPCLTCADAPPHFHPLLCSKMDNVSELLWACLRVAPQLYMSGRLLSSKYALGNLTGI